MVKRELYLKKIRPFYESDLIKVLTGIRRCGKSILLKQIITEIKQNGISDDHIIYMNLEDMKYAFVKNAMDLYGYVDKLIVDEENNKVSADHYEVQNINKKNKSNIARINLCTYTGYITYDNKQSKFYTHTLCRFRLNVSDNRERP